MTTMPEPHGGAYGSDINDNLANTGDNRDHGTMTNPATIITDPRSVENAETIPGDTLITTEVWAKLQGVKLESVKQAKWAADMRRRNGNPKRGDLPVPEMTVSGKPLYSMAQYRETMAARPGRGGGPGRKPYATARERRAIFLPLLCPCGCGYEITGKDFALIPAHGRDYAGEAARKDEHQITDAKESAEEA